MGSADTPSEQVNYKPGIIRWVIISIIFLILITVSLFLSAGTLNWQMAWVYVAIAAIIQMLDAIVLIPISPELLGERSRYQKGAKKMGSIPIKNYGYHRSNNDLDRFWIGLPLLMVS